MFTHVFCSKCCSEQSVDKMVTPHQGRCYLRGTLLFYCSCFYLVPRKWQFPAGLCNVWIKTIAIALLVFHHAPAIYFACPKLDYLMWKCLFSKDRGICKKMWTWNKTGIFFWWILISKPNLENISAVLNVTAGISLIFWLTKILCHLHKNYSHLASNSFTQVISLPFHAVYYRNTKLMNSCSCQ